VVALLFANDAATARAALDDESASFDGDVDALREAHDSYADNLDHVRALLRESPVYGAAESGTNDRERRLDRLDAVFAARFPNVATVGEAKYFSSPGRINIIGEHVDHQDGFALPAAVQLGVLMKSQARVDDEVVLHSLDLEEPVRFSLDAVSVSGDAPPCLPAPVGPHRDGDGDCEKLQCGGHELHGHLLEPVFSNGRKLQGELAKLRSQHLQPDHCGGQDQSATCVGIFDVVMDQDLPSEIGPIR